EQAGGSASTGTQPVLDEVPGALHQRSPLIIGSRENVEQVESFIQERARLDQDASAT
ncbi:MAG: class 1 fructose-bisphosphatase, partial [Cyanobacteria bacterium P01_A01_bin.135]